MKTVLKPRTLVPDEDGKGPLQAYRVQRWEYASGAMIMFAMVEYIGCAGMIVVDELHDAAAATATPYTLIIRLMLDNRPPGYRTGVVG